MPEHSELSDHFSLGYDMGQAQAYCECVALGCKPAASFMVRKAHKAKIESVVADWGLTAILREREDEWIEVDIVADVELAPVVAELWTLLSEGSTPFFEWAKGKLFGYGDASIMSHLRATYEVVRGGAASDQSVT